MWGLTYLHFKHAPIWYKFLVLGAAALLTAASVWLAWGNFLLIGGIALLLFLAVMCCQLYGAIGIILPFAGLLLLRVLYGLLAFAAHTLEALAPVILFAVVFGYTASSYSSKRK